jgi:hypothetical protein
MSPLKIKLFDAIAEVTWKDMSDVNGREITTGNHVAFSDPRLSTFSRLDSSDCLRVVHHLIFCTDIESEATIRQVAP